MREIKFQGERLDNKELIIGDLIRINGNTFIFPDPAPDGIDRYMVDPATVGQFTGMKDFNGNEIFEKNTVVFSDPVTFEKKKGIVVWYQHTCCFYISDKSNRMLYPLISVLDLTIS